VNFEQFRDMLNTELGVLATSSHIIQI